LSTDSYFHRLLPGRPGAPIVFALHGTGGDENQFFDLAARLVPGATIVSPRGDVSEFGAARFFRRTGEGVYDMDDLARATARMGAFMHAQAEAAGAGRVLAFGYSNGANILASVLFSEPGFFSGVGLLHPLIPFEPRIAGSLADTPILMTAGRRDPICPPDLTLRLETRLRAAEAVVTLAWHEGGHEIRPEEIDALNRHLSRPTMPVVSEGA